MIEPHVAAKNDDTVPVGEEDMAIEEGQEDSDDKRPKVERFVALTGRFEMNHANLQRLIDACPGLTFTCNVTKQTSFLVLGQQMEECAKLRAAKRYNVPVYGAKQLAILLGLDSI